MKRSGDISESPPKHVGNKAIILNYDFVEGLFDADGTCLYCLTNKQVQILIALLPYIGWRTRWESPSGAPIDQDELDQLEAGLGAALMSDVCSEIMTKLDDIKTKVDDIKTLEDTIHTELMELKTDLDVSQAAQDAAIGLIQAEIVTTIEPALALLATAVAGVAANTISIKATVESTATDVTDIDSIISDPDDGLAEVSEDVDNIELLVAKMRNTITNITNNTIITLNVGLPNQTFASDTSDVTPTRAYARYNALCAAVVDWILLELWATLDTIGGTSTDLATILSAVNVNVQSFAYAVANGTNIYTTTEIYGAAVDSTAVYDVACAIIDYLVNKEATPENFNSALSSYTPPAYPDHRKIIYDTLQIAMLALNGWQVFSAQMDAEFQTALDAAPTAYSCPPCGTFPGYCGFPETWDFTLGQKAPWLINRGQLQIGVGIVGSQIPGDLNFGIDTSIYFGTGGCAALHGHHVEFDHAHIAAVTNAWTIEFYSVNLTTGAIVKYNSSNRSQTAAWPAVDVDSIVIPTPVAGTALYQIRFYANTPYYGNATNQPSTASKITIAKLLT